MANLQHHAQPKHTDLNDKASGQSILDSGWEGAPGGLYPRLAPLVTFRLFGGDTGRVLVPIPNSFMGERVNTLYTSTMLGIFQ